MNALPALRYDCPCKKKKCERHGFCIECHTYHSEGKARPYCLRKDKFTGYARGDFSPPRKKPA
jgi:hypothetical protein